MPNADSFTALGEGNGFPARAGKVNVSVYDHWVTLGGTEKGNTATESEKKLSLVNAMKLYWNLHSATASFTATWSDSAIPYSLDKSLPNHEYVIELEPKERLCQSIPPVRSSTSPTPAELTATSGTGCSTSGILNILRPVRMYDGSTSDESNFVGYGVNDFFSGSSGGSHPEGIASGGAIVRVASYLDGTTDSGSSESPTGSGNFSYFNSKASILNLDGIPFRSFCSATAFTTAESIFSKTLTSSANSASASVASTSGGESSSVVGSVTIPEDFGFDFYTY
jgi:hypothetical protein|tara:strand:+ start:63 stop:905 length:843 start_codon:yes stop_codon:yes gene_type:complete